MFPVTPLPQVGARARVARAFWLWGENGLVNWNSRQDSNLQPRRSKRRALPFELQERKMWSIVPDSNRCLSVGNAVS